MPIIGFNISKIEAERKKQVSGKLNINNTPKIEKLELVDINNLGKEISKCIRVDYEFSTEYEPKIGSIKFSGEILYLDPKQEEIVKQWKKDKKIPDVMMMELLNFMFRKLITRSLLLAEELQLPPSIPFPSAQLQQGEGKNPKYIE